MFIISICILPIVYRYSSSTRGRMCMPSPGPRMKVLLSSIGQPGIGQPIRGVGGFARRALYSHDPACHAMGAHGDPRKKRWVGCQVGVLSSDPRGSIWGLQAEQGPGRGAPSTTTSAPFRFSGFGERRRRYRRTKYAGSDDPWYCGAPLDPPGRNPSRT